MSRHKIVVVYFQPIQSTAEKMFVVVQFIGDFMEAVPSRWLRELEMVCLWTPHRFPSRAIRSRRKTTGRLLQSKFSTEQVNEPSTKTSDPLRWLKESETVACGQSTRARWTEECEIGEKDRGVWDRRVRHILLSRIRTAWKNVLGDSWWQGWSPCNSVQCWIQNWWH